MLRFLWLILLFMNYLAPIGSVVLLQGTSSIGKTTLAYELKKHLDDTWSIVSIHEYVSSLAVITPYEVECIKKRLLVNFDNIDPLNIESLLMNKLCLDVHESVGIAPSFTYDICIETGTLNPKTSAKIILGLI